MSACTGVRLYVYVYILMCFYTLFAHFDYDVVRAVCSAVLSTAIALHSAMFCFAHSLYIYAAAFIHQMVIIFFCFFFFGPIHLDNISLSYSLLFNYLTSCYGHTIFFHQSRPI